MSPQITSTTMSWGLFNMGMQFQAASSSVLAQAVNKSLALNADTFKDDCNFYCKMDTGRLIDSSYTVVKGTTCSVVWATPYARRQYYTGRPSKDRNANASLQWAAKAQRTYGKQWAALIEKGIKHFL